ncbi:hypothetical protein LUZ61_017958 [Rhynchospora tenuis]|uniref:KIB1-4 beta-propeller domain-containing protein n=1 Tax=Rhynchospora tenuis TaxID=198213 RepID=A0AAD5Z8D2_9POAL|nr:hypothetical protein LUZ61_017958 [Rhynchospora tenuis]
MEAKKALQRDWSSLPVEVLNLIAKKLSEISDFVCFRAVCTAWRFSTPSTDLLPQFPWILVKHQNKPDLSFYSIPSNKIYSIHASKSLGKWLYGPLEGYMLVNLNYQSLWEFGDPFALTLQLSLLNPLNNHEILLPAYDFEGLPYRFSCMGEYVFSYGYADYQTPKLVFWHLGQDNWCELNLSSDYVNCKHICLKSMIFNVERETGVTKVIDIATGTLVYVIPPIEGYSAVGSEFIVDAFGDILRVFQHDDPYTGLVYDTWFDVHRLEIMENGSPCWVKVDNIGNQAVFVDSYNCFVLRAHDFAGIKRNCIYFLTRISHGEEAPLYGVERIDIMTGAREHLPCPLKEPKSWFVPSLLSL